MIIMFPCKKIFLAKFVDVSGLISLKNQIALKKDIVIPLPVFILRAISLSLEGHDDLLGMHYCVFRNVPIPILSVEDKGLIEYPEKSGIFSMYQWYEESFKKFEKTSFIDKLNLLFKPSTAARKHGTVSVSFPGRSGVDFCFEDGYSSLSFGIGSAVPLWTDFENEKEIRKWWCWITLSAPECLDRKKLGKLLNSVSGIIQESEFPEINGEIR
ncbi:hypothetical protein JW890_06140 [candidate division WOR-3 bacterium]|nr:hypothetical protein [candidate division WOR-3 bacterium]